MGHTHRLIRIVLLIALSGLGACRPRAVAPTATSSPEASAIVAPSLSAPEATATASAAATASPAATTTVDALATAVDALATVAAGSLDLPALEGQISQGPHASIASPDGVVSLLVSQASLPAGVSAASLKITQVDTASLSLPAALEPVLFAYRLEPDGLQFSSPAVISIATVLSASQAAPMLFTISGKAIEILSPAATELDPATRNIVVVAAIHHFSSLLGELPWLKVTLSSSGSSLGGPHVLDDPFDVSAVTALTAEGKARIERWTLDGRWGAVSVIDPYKVENAPPPIPVYGNSQTSVQTFKCTGVGKRNFIYYHAHIAGYWSIPDSNVSDYWFDEADGTHDLSIACVFLATNVTAKFVQAERATHYTATAYDPDGDKLTYDWAKSNPCGTLTWSATAPEAVWSHPDVNVGGNCPNEPVHKGDVSVHVIDGHGADETITYFGGSASGEAYPP